MKKFMKKANRGLLLTAVVLTVMIIYVLADYISFQSEKETINDTVNQYFTDIYQINTTADGDSENHKKEITNIIDSYWTYEKPSIDWCTTKSDMLNNVKYMFEDLKLENIWLYDVSEVDFNINGLKVQKAGPGYAKVTLNYTASITGKAGSYVITPSNYRSLDYTYSDQVYAIYDYNDIVENNLSTEKQEQLTQLQSKVGTLKYSVQEASIELHKEDGKWKICGFDAWEYESSFDVSGEE